MKTCRLITTFSLLLLLTGGAVARDLTGTTAATEKFNDWVRLIWLAEIDGDAPGVPATTIRIGSRQYTLGADTYDDKLTPRGLEIGWSRLQVGGGLAQVGKAALQIDNLEKESQQVDTYFFENDEVRLYCVFATGSETAADKIEVARLVVENYPFDPNVWDLALIDGSDKDFRAIPAENVNLRDHLYAPRDAVGKVLPVVLGALNVGPFDGVGGDPILAPCRCVNKFTFQFTAGLQKKTGGAPYQYYQHAKRVGKVINYTQSGGYLTITDAVREMCIAPVLPRGTNDVADWFKVGDGDHTVGAAIVLNDNLDLDLGGVPKLGTLTAISLEIKASGGSYNYDVQYNGVSKVSGSATGDKSVGLTASDHTDDWAFERYHVEIDGTANATINEAYLKLTYDDQLTVDRQSLAIFQAVTGMDDQTAYYNADGASNPLITAAAGTALENPAHLIEAVFRAKKLMDLSTDLVDLTALDQAVTDRTGWKFATSLDKAVDIRWLNTFGFEAGLHLFKSFEGKWKVVAQTKTRVPAHTFLDTLNIAVTNPADAPSVWDYDLGWSRTPNRDLINEVVLRYGKDRATGEYTKIKIASGKHRVNGACSVDAATKILTDGSATFQTDGVPVDDGVYVEGDQDYLVDAVNSETQLLLKHPTGGSIIASPAATNYYVGPHLDGRMKRSQLRYKTENPLGKESTETEEGGYTSDLIVDDDTADNVIDHIADWRSQRRLVAEFATFWNAIDVELGDACFLDHPWLPTSKRPIEKGTLSSGLSDSATTLSSANSGLLRTNDFVLIDKEVIKITAYSAATITRGQCNTQAAAHNSGAKIYLLNRVQWEITGIKPEVALEGARMFRLEAQEMPPSYKPTGRVVVAGYDDYSTADATERTLAGWITRPSGRVQEEDEYSNISYVGPSA